MPAMSAKWSILQFKIMVFPYIVLGWVNSCQINWVMASLFFVFISDSCMPDQLGHSTTEFIFEVSVACRPDQLGHSIPEYIFEFSITCRPDQLGHSTSENIFLIFLCVHEHSISNIKTNIKSITTSYGNAQPHIDRTYNATWTISRNLMEMEHIAQPLIAQH